MSDMTAKLGLPFILPAQAQKHVTHNEALQRLDAVVHLAIVAEADDPPASPEDGSCYVVADTPTAAWSGHAGDVAIFQDGLWQFVTPVSGWSAWFADDGTLRCFDGAAWAGPALPAAPSFATVGVNATADATNRLSVSAPATLLNNAGAGHQLKINKAAAADTASLLFQTGWSGRAEMGLSGSDNFAIKVSPDGANWYEALRIAPEGAVVMPQRPLVRAAYAGGTTAITTATALGFDNLYTNQGDFALGTAVAGGGETLLFPVSGYYTVFLTVTATATGAYSVTLQKNGSENSVILRGGGTDGAAVTLAATAITYFSAGDNARLLFDGSATYDLGYGATEVLAMLA
ncbi:DUF2793 domain-containing protein [Martelella endophytica]|uniref:DUF2793 domain-containing protein n=1 Tax=Martelella endophytica TaxID=1486262 RepID=A0A0D5LU41_MAREN|nr:DUF2793 domain-containing protein [Martelella endophytica]AJY47581.1 hypothetical protein TM49_20945 [Martelella endophytica]